MFTVETAYGYVASIKTLCGELNVITEYTSNRDNAKLFSDKQIKSLRLKSFFRYRSTKIIIAEVV